MYKHSTLKSSCISLALLLCWASHGFAKIPEPSTIFYGTATLDGTPLKAADTHVTILIKINGTIVASYRMGDRPAAGDRYVLMVPLDALEPQTPNTARPGDKATLFIVRSGTERQTAAVTIGDKGSIVSLDLKAGTNDADNMPPETTLTGGPTGTIMESSASFSWNGTDNVTPTASLLYAFRLDPLEKNFSPFGPATSKPYTGLANGSYTFFVKAKDQAGNEDPTPASRSFTVRPGRTRTDLNGDGHADLIWRNTITGAVAFWLQDGFGILEARVLATVPLEWTVVHEE